MSDPLAYLITFRCYGTWLHGDERGSMDPRRNGYGGSTFEPNPARAAMERGQMTSPPLLLNDEQRAAVADAVREVCAFRGWRLAALNVRTNHVHVVVTASESPEKLLGSLKSYATRELRAQGLVHEDRRVWARHGSTRYLWSEQAVTDACAYVTHGQS